MSGDGRVWVVFADDGAAYEAQTWTVAAFADKALADEWAMAAQLVAEANHKSYRRWFAREEAKPEAEQEWNAPARKNPFDPDHGNQHNARYIVSCERFNPGWPKGKAAARARAALAKAGGAP